MIQKHQYLCNRQSNLLHFWTQYTSGCALPLGGIVFMAVMSWGVHRSAKCIGGTFSGRKAKIDTTQSVPKCFPGCPVSHITVVTVIQWYFPSFVGRMFNVQKKQEFFETRVLYSGLPP